MRASAWARPTRRARTTLRTRICCTGASSRSVGKRLDKKKSPGTHKETRFANRHCDRERSGKPLLPPHFWPSRTCLVHDKIAPRLLHGVSRILTRCPSVNPFKFSAWRPHSPREPKHFGFPQGAEEGLKYPPPFSLCLPALDLFGLTTSRDSPYRSVPSSNPLFASSNLVFFACRHTLFFALRRHGHSSPNVPSPFRTTEPTKTTVPHPCPIRF